MKNKQETSAENSTLVVDTKLKFIEAALALVESEEMRSHLFKWLTHDSHIRPMDTCAEIIFHAPVPLNQKLSLLKKMAENDECNSDEIGRYVWHIQKAIDETFVSHKKTIFGLYPYDSPAKINPINFKSFEEAVEHIKQLSEQRKNGVLSYEAQDSYGMTISLISKEAPVHDGFKYHKTSIIEWYVTDEGEIICYEDPYLRRKQRGFDIIYFSAPFKSGDIVEADYSPFEGKKKYLILENKDTLESVDHSYVTCLYVNDNEIKVGYFKSGMSGPTEVSVLYRAKTYNGELTETEKPLKIISEAIKKNPKLGSDIFRYFYKFNGDAFMRYPMIRSYDGVEWKTLASEFGLH